MFGCFVVEYNANVAHIGFEKHLMPNGVGRRLGHSHHATHGEQKDEQCFFHKADVYVELMYLRTGAQSGKKRGLTLL